MDRFLWYVRGRYVLYNVGQDKQNQINRFVYIPVFISAWRWYQIYFIYFFITSPNAKSNLIYTLNKT